MSKLARSDLLRQSSQTIPDLEHHCGSWIIVDRTTGKPVLELFSRNTVEAINQDRYEIVTANQWLSRLNGILKQTG